MNKSWNLIAKASEPHKWWRIRWKVAGICQHNFNSTGLKFHESIAATFVVNNRKESEMRRLDAVCTFIGGGISNEIFSRWTKCCHRRSFKITIHFSTLSNQLKKNDINEREVQSPVCALRFWIQKMVVMKCTFAVKSLYISKHFTKRCWLRHILDNEKVITNSAFRKGYGRWFNYRVHRGGC